MSTDFLGTKNFKARLTTGILLVLIVIAALFTPNAVLFRILYFAGGVMAILELYLAQKTHNYREIPLRDDRIPILEYIVLIVSVYAFTTMFTSTEMALVLLGATSTDIFAYFVGSAFHDRFFKKRPFPKTSPKKSWEGIIGGYIGSVFTLVVSVVVFRMTFSPLIVIFIALCPIVSICGDYIASYCKRYFSIKDSNECILYTKCILLKKLEKLMSGHGGYLDRIDSISMVACLMFWVKLAS